MPSGATIFRFDLLENRGDRDRLRRKGKHNFARVGQRVGHGKCDYRDSELFRTKNA